MKSLKTVIAIRENKVGLKTIQSKGGKYRFEIYGFVNGEHYFPYLTSRPIYESDETARANGENVLSQIKLADINRDGKALSELLEEVVDFHRPIYSKHR